MSSAPKEHVARHLAVSPASSVVMIDIPFLPGLARRFVLPMIGAVRVDVFLGAAHLLFLPVWVLQFPLASRQLPQGLV